MSDPEFCVLGQSFPRYLDGIDELALAGHRWPSQFGFDLGDRPWVYEDLDVEWRRVILAGRP